jgi:hypothetical protein
MLDLVAPPAAISERIRARNAVRAAAALSSALLTRSTALILLADFGELTAFLIDADRQVALLRKKLDEIRNSLTAINFIRNEHGDSES